MTKEEFAETIRAIGWSEMQTAERLRMPQTTLRRLLSRDELPEAQAKYLRLIADIIAAIPVPDL